MPGGCCAPAKPPRSSLLLRLQLRPPPDTGLAGPLRDRNSSEGLRFTTHGPGFTFSFLSEISRSFARMMRCPPCLATFTAEFVGRGAGRVTGVTTIFPGVLVTGRRSVSTGRRISTRCLGDLAWGSAMSSSSVGGQLLGRRPKLTRRTVRSSGPLGTVSCGLQLLEPSSDWQLRDVRSDREKKSPWMESTSLASSSAQLGSGEPGDLGVGGQDSLNSFGCVSLAWLCTRPALLRSVAWRAFRQFTWFRRSIALTSRRFSMTSSSSSSLELRQRFARLFRESWVKRETLLASEYTLNFSEHTEGQRSSASSKRLSLSWDPRAVCGARGPLGRASRDFGVRGERILSGRGERRKYWQWPSSPDLRRGELIFLHCTFESKAALQEQIGRAHV